MKPLHITIRNSLTRQATERLQLPASPLDKPFQGPIDQAVVSTEALRAHIAETVASGSPALKDAYRTLERITSGPQGKKAAWAHVLRSGGLAYLRRDLDANNPHRKTLDAMTSAERSQYFRVASFVLALCAPDVGHSKDPAKNPIGLFRQAANVEHNLDVLDKEDRAGWLVPRLLVATGAVRDLALPKAYIEHAHRRAWAIVEPRFRDGAARFGEAVRAGAPLLDEATNRDGVSIIEHLTQAIMGDNDRLGRPASLLLLDGHGHHVGLSAIALAMAAAGYRTWSARGSSLSREAVLGTPPGYLAHGSATCLLDEIRLDPKTAIFITEADKLDPGIRALLNEARMGAVVKDMMGTDVDCSQCIFIDVVEPPKDIEAVGRALEAAVAAHGGRSLSADERREGAGAFLGQRHPITQHLPEIAATGHDPSGTLSDEALASYGGIFHLAR